MLNDDIRELLEAVSVSDQRRAKDKAIAICQKELEKGSASNKRLCDSVIRNIKSRPQWMEIPALAKNLLIYEDLEQTFDDRLYYFSAEEQELERRILMMTNTCAIATRHCCWVRPAAGNPYSPVISQSGLAAASTWWIYLPS